MASVAELVSSAELVVAVVEPSLETRLKTNLFTVGSKATTRPAAATSARKPNASHARMPIRGLGCSSTCSSIDEGASRVGRELDLSMRFSME